MQRIAWILIFAAVFSTHFLSTPNAMSTSFAPQAFPKTVYDAPVIVKGKIGMNYSDWGSDETGTKRIYTFYELQISEVLKGNATGTSLTMREMGGTAGGVGMDVPGASHYDRGENVVVFLRDKNSDGSYDVQGLMMGKLNIEVTSDNEETLSGPALNTAAQRVATEDSTEAHRTWTVKNLRQLILDQKTQKSQNYSDTPAQASQQTDPSASRPPQSGTPGAPQLQKTLPAKDMRSTQVTAGLKSFLVGLMVFMGARWKRSLRSKK